MEPKFIDAYINLGLALENIEDFKGAIENYRRAIEIGLSDKIIYFGLGTALHSVGDF